MGLEEAAGHEERSFFNSVSRRGGEGALQRNFDFRGFESERARLALISDAPIPVDHIETVRPGSVRAFSGVSEVVNQRRDFDGKLRNTSLSHGAPLPQAFVAADGNFFFEVRFFLPGIDGVSFLDIDHEKLSARLVLLEKLVERRDLPAERRSSVAAEDQDDGFLFAEGGKLDEGFLVTGGKQEVGRAVPSVRQARPGALGTARPTFAI